MATFELPHCNVVTGQDCVSFLSDDRCFGERRRVMVVSGRNTGANEDVVRRIRSVLGPRFVGWFDGALPGFPVSAIEAGVAFAGEHRADAFVSVGGGTAIDSTKSIATAHALGGVDALLAPPDPHRRESPRPHIVGVMTTLAAAELNGACGMRLATGEDVYVGRPESTPRVLVYDPYLASTTPRTHLLTTAFNGFDHAIDMYCGRPLESRLAEVLAVASAREFVDVLPELADRPSLEAIHRLQVAAAMSGLWIQELVVMQSRRHGLLHAFGHALKLHGVPQGVAHAITMPHALGLLARTAEDRVASFGEEIGYPVHRATPAASARATVEYLKALRDGLGIPTRLSDVRDEVDADAIAKTVMMDPSVRWAPFDVTEAAVADAIRAAT